MTCKDLYRNLTSMRKAYITHRYFIYNDAYHWPIILASVSDFGEITHSDYSENMSQNQYEAQACHFNKTAYSLHCTVEHVDSANYPNFKSPYRYLYHLSDDMKPDFAFTSTVANHCIDINKLPTIIRRKSDYCGTQYKSKWVFGEYQN